MHADWTPAPGSLLDDRARRSYGKTLPVLDRLRRAGWEAYLVGGGIRDLLLGREVADWDIATEARPEQVLELWPEAIPTGLRHGTVTVLTPEPVEITTYRGEGPYGDGRRPDWVRFDVGLIEDLSRRDFTINALALDPAGERVLDPHQGLEDLRARRLRTVGDADLRFAEDGLRPLRGIRIAAVLELTVEPPLRDAMARSAELVQGVARERVGDELRKLLRARRPSVGIELLRETGLLAFVLPELLEGVGVSQNRYHAYDVYEHALYAVDAAPADNPVVRLAALLHDLGKPRTREGPEGEGTFHGHEHVGARMAAGVMDRLRFPRPEKEKVVQLIQEHMFHYTPEWSDAAVRRFLQRVGAETVPDLFALRRADAEAAGTGKDPEPGLRELGERVAGVVARAEALGIADLEVSGDDVMRELDLAPGPRVGDVLRGLLERVLEDPELNRREILLKLVHEIGRSS